MRTLILSLVAVALVGCGSRESAVPAEAAAPTAVPAHGAMPADDAHAGVTDQGQVRHDTGINTQVQLSDAVRTAWRGIKVRVQDTSTGGTTDVEVPIGATVALGDSGLSLTATAFVPDFVMDPSGITSRSNRPDNPAANVIITEAGKEPYHGWLFAALPDIHPFPHDRYKVLLVEGVPAT